MAIRFGTSSGYKTKTDFRISEGELDCGSVVHMFIKTIEKSYTFEDEYSICSIGIIDDAEMCYENVSLKLREEAAPKYEPVEEVKTGGDSDPTTGRGATAVHLAAMGADGKAATTLACTPIKIKTGIVELNATQKDVDAVPTPDALTEVSTADGVYTIGDLIELPDDGNYIITSQSIDLPTDDFGSGTITYTKKLPYPDEATRTAWLAGVDAYFSSGDVFDPDRSTVEIEVNFRQGEVPIKRCTVTKYGLIDMDDTPA